MRTSFPLRSFLQYTNRTSFFLPLATRTEHLGIFSPPLYLVHLSAFVNFFHFLVPCVSLLFFYLYYCCRIPSHTSLHESSFIILVCHPISTCVASFRVVFQPAPPATIRIVVFLNSLDFFSVFFSVFLCTCECIFFSRIEMMLFRVPKWCSFVFVCLHLRPTVITNVDHAVFVYPVTTAWCSGRCHVYHTTDILSTWSPPEVLVSTIL